MPRRYLRGMNCGARPFEGTEKSQILAALTGYSAQRDRALIQLGVYSGLRVSSLLALKVGDVINGRRFHPRLRVARRNLKGKHAGLDIPLHPVAKIALGRWLVERRSRGERLLPTAPLFPSRQGKAQPLSRRRAREIIQEAAARAGLPPGISTHSWRKTFAGRLYEATGHNILLVSRALNHRQLATSISYLRWKLDEKADAAILSL